MRAADPHAVESEIADNPSDDEDDGNERYRHPLDGPVAIWNDVRESECPACHACSARRVRKRRAAASGPRPEGYGQWAMVADGEVPEGTVLLGQ
eukprot:2939322-Lingulodinium_polyedra.AAC.1